MKVNMTDLKAVYDEEIKKNVRNKKKLFDFEKHKIEYFCDIKKTIENMNYSGGKYNIFLVYYPKVRVVMSQNIYDKLINHYITRFILMPKFDKYLSPRNCATRKNMGMHYAIDILKSDIEKFKKYDNFYFLKIDIKKYFYTLDHNVIMNILRKELNEEELQIMQSILNSTNKRYINMIIKNLEKNVSDFLPLYQEGKGLPIGNMSSQYLAILYLSDLHHYITHNLHVSFVNYMDDYILIHQSKERLKEVLKILESKLENEYKLKLNPKKTKITSSKEGVNFLGYNFRVIDKKTIIRLANSTKQNIKRGIRKSKYLYQNNLMNFQSYFCSIQSYRNNYRYIDKYKRRYIFNRYI